MKAILVFILIITIPAAAHAQSINYSGRASGVASVNITLKITGSFKANQNNIKGTGSIPRANISYQLYPNPAHNDITLDLQGDKTGPFTIIIYDISGKIKDKTEDMNTQSAAYSHVFNTAAYTPGNYFLKITSNSGDLYKSISFSKE